MLVGPATYERIRDMASVDPLGPVGLQGKLDPVELCALEEPTGPYS